MGFPHHMQKKKVFQLYVYRDKDFLSGVMQYALLKKKFEKKINEKFNLFIRQIKI